MSAPASGPREEHDHKRARVEDAANAAAGDDNGEDNAAPQPNTPLVVFSPNAHMEGFAKRLRDYESLLPKRIDILDLHSLDFAAERVTSSATQNRADWLDDFWNVFNDVFDDKGIQHLLIPEKMFFSLWLLNTDTATTFTKSAFEKIYALKNVKTVAMPREFVERFQKFVDAQHCASISLPRCIKLDADLAWYYNQEFDHFITPLLTQARAAATQQKPSSEAERIDWGMDDVEVENSRCEDSADEPLSLLYFLNKAAQGEFLADRCHGAHYLADKSNLPFKQNWTKSLYGLFNTNEDTFSGQQVKIAILDSGLDVFHRFAPEDVVKLKSYIGSWAGSDHNGHGTHVAGIISGKHFGLAPGAKLFIAQVLDVKRTEFCSELFVELAELFGRLAADPLG